jgi:hypothetical protein
MGEVQAHTGRVPLLSTEQGGGTHMMNEPSVIGTMPVITSFQVCNMASMPCTKAMYTDVSVYCSYYTKSPVTSPATC